MKPITYKYWKFGLVLLTLTNFLLVSCLKDKGPVEDYSKSPALVSFQYTGTIAQPFNVSIFGQTTDTFALEVTLSVASLTLNSTVTATIAPDPQAVTDYNTANGTSYTQLPPNLYTLPNAGKVTINPGQQIVTVTIHFAGDQVDFSQDNALGLKITDAQGATVASNLNTAVLLLKLRNAYEGNYQVTGYFYHPSAPRAINQTKFVATVSKYRVETQLGDLGSPMQFDIDPVTNKLSNLTPGPGSPGDLRFLSTDNESGLFNTPNAQFNSTIYNNTYDPATHTFWLHYGYRTPATRDVYEKYVLIP